MTLASILILAGIVCLALGLLLPVGYAVRVRLQERGRSPQRRARLVGATGAISGMGPR